MLFCADWLLRLRFSLVLSGILAGSVFSVAAQERAWQQSSQRYALPRTQLQGADGVVRPLAKVLDDGRPTVLTFMYSSCATVCPITNQTLVQFEQLLGAERSKVNTVSISIDPTYDSVQKLGEYARRTGASGSYYTGDPGASEAVQRAFNVWRGGDKMTHKPVFLLKAQGSDTWVRVDGLVTPRELLSVYKGLAVASVAQAGR
jgi:protein SCO1